MKKILILLLCLLAINISGCSKKDNNDNENTNQINEATYINYLEKDSNFFNTAFSKDEEENLYFVYYSNVYKVKNDSSIETLLNFKDMNMHITKAKYYHGYLFMCVYRSNNPAYNTGILRMNLENNELKMFDTPHVRPFSLLIDNKKIYLDVSCADSKNRYASFDFDNSTGELSNYKLIEKFDYPVFVQDKYLQNKYPEYYGNMSTQVNYDNETIYIYETSDIEKINLKTHERQLYYLNDIYKITDLLDKSYGALDIIDDRIYLIGEAGVTSYDKDFEDMQFIIDNRDK